MRWALLAFAIIAALIGLTTLLGLRARRPAPRVFNPRRAARHDRFDPLHREVAHYRASGALPRWDP